MLAFTGATDIEAMSQGHQSTVFRLDLANGRRAAAKVLDASLVDHAAVSLRVEAVAELSEIDTRACRPLPIDDKLVNTIVGADGMPALLLCSEFADGVALDVAVEDDAELMGSTLAGLHQSLSRLAPRPLPVVAALHTLATPVDETFQVVHGDFNTANLRRNDTAVKIFDFEDCGYGPCSFDVANALYMVLFDSTIEGRVERYRVFEGALLRGYETTAAIELDRTIITQHIEMRVRALGRWLDDLGTAPVGIRTAAPEWRETLRSFVRAHER